MIGRCVPDIRMATTSQDAAVGTATGGFDAGADIRGSRSSSRRVSMTSHERRSESQFEPDDDLLRQPGQPFVHTWCGQPGRGKQRT